MTKIINGKRYDTENATQLGTGGSGGSQSDFRYFEESLYITPRSKNYFLAGEGHGMSHWGESRDGGNSRGWGEGIKPLSKKDALDWAEKYLDAAEIEDFFGEMIKDA